MNSVAQLLLSGTVPELSRRYGGDKGTNVAAHILFQGISPKEATTDMLSQTAKLSLALTTGAYAVPESELGSDIPLEPQYRLQPRMFKHVVAGNHVEFRTGQQQDAAQFLQYMLEQIDRAELGGAQRLGLTGTIYPASQLFSFQTTTRLVCSKDQKVKYKESAKETVLSLPVPMEKATVNVNEPEEKRHKSDDSTKEEKPVPTIAISACLESWAAETTVDDYRWSHLGGSIAGAVSQTRFSNFPRYLLIQIQRYTLGADWTPQKLEVNLDIPQELDLSEYKSSGPQNGEDLVPDEGESKDEDKRSAPTAPVIDENALAQLMDMGFSFNGCKRALTAVGGSDVQSAMNWVFEHSTDPDFNDPLPESGNASMKHSSSSDMVDDFTVMSLAESLGCFTTDQVRAALKHTDGAADRAADWLFSHMDDLDGAIASLSSGPDPQVASSQNSLPLEDGDGKYTMLGMISHIGKHTGSGHYVAHLKRGETWVIFNDEKVALSETPPYAHAYIYLYQRNDTLGNPHEEY
jgi:ubiquitin carboxyl-terminal hydrolase 5/13